MKDKILECLHHLISRNVGSDRAYKNRYAGFIGELEFQNWFRLNRASTETFTGGYFLPVKVSTATLENPVYFTVSDESYLNNGYTEIYQALSKIPCKSMYFIYWNKNAPFETWEKKYMTNIGIMLPVPPMTIYIFNKISECFTQTSLQAFLTEYKRKDNKNNSSFGDIYKNCYIESLKSYESYDLLKIYVQRLIFDGFLGFYVERGIPSDIDFILKSDTTHTLQFLEIKDKDLSKKPPQGFGMDIRRINDLSTITQITGIKFYYVVRRVNNQTERQFIEWLIVDMSDFITHSGNEAVQGGCGMRAEGTNNPTLICPVKHFKKLE